MNIFSQIANLLVQSKNNQSEDQVDSTESSQAASSQQDAITRDIHAEKLTREYIKGLELKDELTLQESLAIGMEKTKQAGVTKEQAEAMETQEIAKQALKDIELSNIQHEKSAKTDYGRPSSDIKAKNFEPDRGELPSFATKKKPNN